MYTDLHGLTIIHFHHVEIKTVYSFARGDEIAPLLVEMLSNVDEYLWDIQGLWGGRGNRDIKGTLLLHFINALYYLRNKVQMESLLIH